MPIADCRLPNYDGKVEMDGKRPNEPRDDARHTGEARSASHSAIGNRQSAFTLIEMLVVIGIIAILAGMLTAVIIYARNLSIRAECQQNLNHIGQTVSLLVLSNNGLYPHLTNAYPTQQASDPDTIYPPQNPAFPWNNSGFPWWARVFEQWDEMRLLFARNPDGSYKTYVPAANSLDAALNPNGHSLIPNFQMPRTMDAFHCRMAGALDGSSAANLFNSISYGINFDVKDASGLPYCASSGSSPYSPDFPSPQNPAGVLSAADKQPDPCRGTEIQNPGQFILISEANTRGPEWTAPPAKPPLPPPVLNWTGGRISMGYWPNVYPYQRNAADVPPNNAPIVGRHRGYANVLFADYHVEAIQVAFVPGQNPSASLNINYDYSQWTLPGK